MATSPETPRPSRRGLLKTTLTAAGMSLTSSASSGEARSDGPAAERLEALIRDHVPIQRARRAGLDVLKPNRRDLEHGLELHRQALVFDAYGFAPRAALDGAALARAIDGGASDVEMQDLTEDMGMVRGVTDV